jgi:hypothetical protein
MQVYLCPQIIFIRKDALYLKEFHMEVGYRIPYGYCNVPQQNLIKKIRSNWLRTFVKHLKCFLKSLGQINSLAVPTVKVDY